MKKKKTPKDQYLLAKSIVDQATSETHDAAVILGRMGGRKGGPSRASKLSPERRKEIARGAAQARWRKKRS